MSFNSVFRRTSAYITPLAFRSIGFSRSWVCSIEAARIIECSRSNPNLRSSFLVNQLPHFSTASIINEKKMKKRKQKLQSDDDVCKRNLIRTLNSEIKCVVSSDLFTIAVDVPTGFPFKVEDNPGRRRIVLTKEFEGENITIEVDMPSKDNATAVEEEREMETSIPILVSISKGNDGSYLQFGAKCLPDGFSVHRLSLNKSGNSEDGLAYVGPNFLKLNEDMRNAFEKYLETRGLTSGVASFLLEYMMCKDTEEYLRWLRTLKKLIEH